MPNHCQIAPSSTSVESRFPQEEALYPGLLQVKDVCSADSLAGFAADILPPGRPLARRRKRVRHHCVRRSR
ncbi:hypothetical protein ACVXG9_27935 [Escherichia coli]